MKELICLRRARLLRKALKLAYRDVAKQHCRVGGSFPADFFVDVANSNIYRPGLLVAAELRQVGFIGGEDNGCNCCALR